MTSKGEAHESLSLLFQRDGVPPTMIFDGSQEQTHGNFKRKLREANCHGRQTEPYSPWQNAAGCIRKLKRGVSRKMMKTGSPKVLWDHCIELEALIRSNTSNDIYMTYGEVPETIMTGSTAGISHICEFAWYDWVMFRDNVPTFPDDKLILGHYLGPAIDVGSALTAKILKANGRVVFRSTLRHLTDDERACPVQTANRKAFDDSIAERLGPAALAADFPDEDLTPEYEPFGEIGSADSDVEPDPEDLEVTPEAHDNYVGVDLLFPKGGTMTRGHVTARKREADGNPKGRANDNPLLDTREYTVEFEVGEVTELTANLIAESMYVQCDPDGNQYVDLRVPVQRFVPTLPHLCAKWDTHPVRLTLTYGLKPIPDQTTTNMYYLTCCLTIDDLTLRSNYQTRP